MFVSVLHASDRTMAPLEDNPRSSHAADPMIHNDRNYTYDKHVCRIHVSDDMQGGMI